MNMKPIVTGSVIGNVLLLGAVAWLVKQYPGDDRYPAPIIVCTSRAQPATAASGADKRAPAFDWRRVESEEYKQYLGNLRNVGCPDKTIQEIAAGDLRELMQARATGQARLSQ